MSLTQTYLDVIRMYGADHYYPLEVVITSGKGAWVTDVEDKMYLDCISCYSALNQGHCHPRIFEAMVEQARKGTAFGSSVTNDQMGPFFEKLAKLCGMQKVLMAQGGAEAVETAIKLARKWAYTVRTPPVEPDRANIIVFRENFHGRTTTISGFSSTKLYKKYFGPYAPGAFKMVEYGNFTALAEAIDENTAAVLFEPIQGEGGIIVPPAGYLQNIRHICTERNILMIADEIQTGFGRTGRLFCCDYENVKPDMFILGKALSGGFYPVSAVVTSEDIMCFKKGEHGSTFGANPLACAIASEAIDVTVDEQLAENSYAMGAYLRKELRAQNFPYVKEIRGKGLFIGIEFTDEVKEVRPICEKLLQKGLLCKDTHGKTIRLAPPLIIKKWEADFILDRLQILHKLPL